MYIFCFFFLVYCGFWWGKLLWCWWEHILQVVFVVFCWKFIPFFKSKVLFFLPSFPPFCGGFDLFACGLQSLRAHLDVFPWCQCDAPMFVNQKVTLWKQHMTCLLCVCSFIFIDLFVFCSVNEWVLLLYSFDKNVVEFVRSFKVLWRLRITYSHSW